MINPIIAALIILALIVCAVGAGIFLDKTYNPEARDKN